MKDKQPELEELYIILADYSDDLHKLKKRDKKLPAEAAVARILEWRTDSTLELLPEKGPEADVMVSQDIMSIGTPAEIQTHGFVLGYNQAIKEMERKLK